jgi:hypothetical protein
MKPAAFLLTIIWTLVVVQPAFALFGGESAYGKCSKMTVAKTGCSKMKTSSTCSMKKKSGCSKKKCNKQSSPCDKSGCNSNGCNPSIGCSSGNFFVHHNYSISFLALIAGKQLIAIKDDNRISKSLSECFHPPEV